MKAFLSTGMKAKRVVGHAARWEAERIMAEAEERQGTIIGARRDWVRIQCHEHGAYHSLATVSSILAEALRAAIDGGAFDVQS